MLSSLLLLPALALASPFQNSHEVASRAVSDSVEMVSATWFAGWHASTEDTPTFGLNDLSWEKYTSVAYSFA